VKDALVERDMTVVLTLDWGKEVKDPRPKAKKDEKSEEKEEAAKEGEEGAESKPEEAAQASGTGTEAKEAEPVWEYEEPYSVRLERRTKWEEGRDCALRLHDAGVRFVFGTANAKPKELLEHVRTLVESGLPADAALTALTLDAAEFLGVGRRLGRIEPGFDATLALWRADPLSVKDASVAWLFVDGFPCEFKEEKKKEKKPGAGPGKGIDPTGEWQLEFVVEGEGIKRADLTLTMEKDGSLKGTIEVESPMGGDKIKTDVEGHVSGAELELECTLAFGQFEIETTLTATIEGYALDGDGKFHGPWGAEPRTQAFSGKRTPE
jgi:hypothetical protein